MKVPAFSDIGKEAKELLYGSRTSGLFQYDTKLTANLKTSHAVDFALSAIKKDAVVVMETKGLVKNGPFNVEINGSSSKVTGTFSSVVLEGLKLTLAASAPDVQTSGKVTLDYVHPYFTTKATCTLNKTPTLEVSAAAGHNGLVLGAEAFVDVAKSQISKWNAAVSFVGTEFVVATHLLDGADTLKGSYHQKVDAASTIGAEVVQKLSTKKIDVSIGYSNRAVNGDIRKLKISNDGTMHALYEFKPRPELTAALSVMASAIDTTVPPRFGVSLDYSPAF